jgi:hypothetical protein
MQNPQTSPEPELHHLPHPLFSVTLVKYWRDELLKERRPHQPWAYEKWMDTAEAPQEGWQWNKVVQGHVFCKPTGEMQLSRRGSVFFARTPFAWLTVIPAFVSTSHLTWDDYRQKEKRGDNWVWELNNELALFYRTEYTARLFELCNPWEEGVQQGTQPVDAITTPRSTSIQDTYRTTGWSASAQQSSLPGSRSQLGLPDDTASTVVSKLHRNLDQKPGFPEELDSTPRSSWTQATRTQRSKLSSRPPTTHPSFIAPPGNSLPTIGSSDIIFSRTHLTRMSGMTGITRTTRTNASSASGKNPASRFFKDQKPIVQTTTSLVQDG